MRQPMLILVGLNCKHVAPDRMGGFLDRMARTVLGVPPCAITFDLWKAPNPALFSRKTGFAGWLFWDQGTITLDLNAASSKITLILNTEINFSIMDVDLLFRWFFSPASVLNSIPVLTSARG